MDVKTNQRFKALRKATNYLRKIAPGQIIRIFQVANKIDKKNHTFQSVIYMNTDSSYQPTLWRTCRVLANNVRLKILDLLIREPGQTVSTVAAHLDLSLPLTSQYLRALEARGLLTVRRAGKWVNYRPRRADAMNSGAQIIAAMRFVFQHEKKPLEVAFRLPTAFTHPRRVEIFRAIQIRPRTLIEIQTATSISIPALRRHLKKLESRDFIECHSGLYVTTRRTDIFGRKLAQLATK
ncbi:MAG: helix-turn-helix domain-containing protein [Limisphaerales bacterium]